MFRRIGEKWNGIAQTVDQWDPALHPSSGQWANWDPTMSPLPTSGGTENGYGGAAPAFNLDENWLRGLGYQGEVQKSTRGPGDNGDVRETSPELIQWLKDKGYSFQRNASGEGHGDKYLGRLVDAQGNQVGDAQEWGQGNEDGFGLAALAATGFAGAAAAGVGAGSIGGVSGMDLAADAGIGGANSIGGAASAFDGAAGNLAAYQPYTGPGSQGFQVAGDNAVAPSGWGSTATGGGGLSSADAAAIYGPEGYGAGASAAEMAAAGGGAGGAAAGGGSGSGWLSSLNSTLGTSLNGDNLLRGAGAIGNGLLSSYTASQALRAQKDATNSANQLLAPYHELGAQGTQGYGDLLKNPSKVLQDPGVAFQMQQGQRNFDNSGAVRGGLYSGQQIKAGMEFNQGQASTALDAALKRYGTAAQIGATGTIPMAGNNISLGDASAASSLYAGNGWRQGVNDLIGRSTYSRPRMSFDPYTGQRTGP